MGKNSREGRLTYPERKGNLSHRHLFSHGFGIKTVVMILRAEDPGGDDGSFPVTASCRGLDSAGGVFDLELKFTPESPEERERLLQDLSPGSLFVVKGEYTISGDEAMITLHNPIYYSVSLHFSEKEIREVFRVNGISIVRR
ncbi:MAG: hypothetical protein WC291_01865 [Thermodesulfovibrionales bacterium]|jgi:hypothetical protein